MAQLSTLEEEVMAMSLADMDVTDPALYQQDKWRPYFARLRREDPVHYSETASYGPMWMATRFDDVMTIASNPRVFASGVEFGGTLLNDLPKGMERETVGRMDPPRHATERRGIQPGLAPENLARFESLIRERTRSVIESLPVDETFDWVSMVSIPLTSMMLATLFDVPLDRRERLVQASHIATVNLADPESPVKTEEERFEAMCEFGREMDVLWQERALREKQPDMISQLAHTAPMKDFNFLQRMATITMLTIAGNDTTRHSMSGAMHGFSLHPEEWDKLRANPELTANAASEIVRYQNASIYFRRNVREDVEVGGKLLRKGDKVVMWFISANRDESVIPDADRLLVDRKNARHHLGFGAGIHRCAGNRLAELQIRILLEEMLRRGIKSINVVSEPVRAFSNLVRGIVSLPVQIRV